MKIDTQDLLNSINESFDRMQYIKLEDIPAIDLYMDQVTSFLDERLKSSSRIERDERLLTKTMINNYAKNDVIPPPVKKKYTKEHMLVLIMMYYYKSFLQINDIKELFDPIKDKMFGKKTEFGLEDIYKEVFEDIGDELPNLKADVLEKFEESQKTFENAPEEDKEYLKLYAFVCKLGCEVFVKKLLIEKIVDSLREHSDEDESRAKEEK